ncbi:MAG TPA: aryl-sulfate sulfotransferase [Pirellulales bacterium]|nr:aryl-sulfate sulfotransferase [Pirellulales bacterium]
MWFRSIFDSAKTTSAAASPRSKKRRSSWHCPEARLHLEGLEDRFLLSGVSLMPSEPAPQLVGEPIAWTATASDLGANPVYQFRVGPEHGPLQVVRDFSLSNSFTWTPMDEGSYEIQVIAKQGFNVTDTESGNALDVVNSRATGAEAVITPTLNPLVALYSVPPTEPSPGPHGTVHVEFALAGDNPSWRSTNELPSKPGKSTNFFVAGMLPSTTYEMRDVFSDGATSSPLLFTTGSLPTTLTFPTFTVQQPPGPGSDGEQDMIFHQLIKAPSNVPNPLATDLEGRVDWYYDTSHSGLTFTQAGQSLAPGGTVLLIGIDHDSPLPGSRNILREIDLAGNVVRETNIAAVNAELTSMGHDVITSFFHDVQRLPNGQTAVIGLTERTVNINGAPTNYIGNMILVLDKNFQVAWAWDAFDHLDVNRGPVLGEIVPPGSPGPTASVPRLPAVDWLHLNAVSWSPADQNLVLSIRHQDWVVKIDYRNGEGDGHILWRLGKDGDFTVNSSDPNPWFSHQHNAHFVDDTTMVLFDNGNTRHAGDPNAHSRGQVWKLDEQTMTATLLLNADLGRYSGALGAAQKLANGDYSFTLGENGPEPPRPPANTVEVTPGGTVVYNLQLNTPEYRAFRISTLYAGTGLPTEKGEQESNAGGATTNAQPALLTAAAVDAALDVTSVESSGVEPDAFQIGISIAADNLATSDLAALVAGNYPSTSDDDVFDDFRICA